jgi:hypothetical protein
MIQVKEDWFYSTLVISLTQVNFCWGGFSNSHPIDITDEGKLDRESGQITIHGRDIGGSPRCWIEVELRIKRC